MELDVASFFGVEPLEMLTNPFDVLCVLLSSGRMLFSPKRLRFVGGLCSGLSTLGPVLSAVSTPVVLEAAANEYPPESSDLSGDVGDDWRRRRREVRRVGGWSTGTLCGEVSR
jgi:hypothetical protein